MTILAASPVIPARDRTSRQRTRQSPYRDQGAVALDKLRFLVPPPQRAAVSTEVVVGQPAEEILRAVRAIDASLLVIGAGGRPRITSRLFGKTGTLLRNSACPVLAVPVGKAREEGAERGTKIAA
jgi:nucleotide-binding universal stress UspA family protein